MMSMLAEASSFAIFVACLLTLICGLICGFISDAILRNTGFGFAINGVLIVVGSMLGACARLAF